jgi:integrase
LEEVDRLRAQLDGTDLLIIDTLLMTGMRISELIGLNIGDVDYGACRIHVRRRDYKGIDAPKSSNGRRQIPITPDLAQRLWNLRKSRPGVGPDDPLFATPTGERHNTDNLRRRMLKPAMRKAGILHGAFHRLRHTCATHLIRHDASPSQAQLWLGHHDPGFTARTYVHLDAGDLPSPSVFDHLLRRAPKATPREGRHSSPVRKRTMAPNG